jgi:hypothetical protein
MSVQVKNAVGGWVMYDPCTSCVIGPVFEAPEIAQDFMRWLIPTSVQDLSARQLEMLYGRYKRGGLAFKEDHYLGREGG